MAQFDKLNEELSTFVDGVNSELLALEGRLKSFTIDTRGISGSFDLLTAELLRVAILFEGVAQKIQSYSNIEQKAAESFADELDTAGNATAQTLDQIDDDLKGFGAVITTADANINTFGKNVDSTARKTETFGNNFQDMGQVVGASAAGLTSQFTVTTDTFATETTKFSDGFKTVFDNVKSASDDLTKSLTNLITAYAAEATSKEDTAAKIKQFGAMAMESVYGKKEESKTEKTSEKINDVLDAEAKQIETINISEILKQYAEKVKEAANAIPSGPTQPPKPPKTATGGSGEEWTNENNEKPKLSKGAGFFEKLAVSSELVGKALANFGQNIYQVQNTMMGAGRVFDLIQKSALQLTADLTKAAFAAAFFVNAFNPAIVQQFTYNLRDLQAVIGAGLLPVLNAFALEVRLLADTLLPVIQTLQPALQELGNAIIGFLTPIIKQIGSSLLTLSNTINSLLGPALSKFAASLGALIGELMRQLTPVINTLAKFFSAFLSVLSVVVNIMKEFAPVLAAAITGFITLIGVQAIAALGAFIASVWAASNVLTLGFAGLIGAIVGFISWLTTKQEESSGLTGVSEGLAARRAEYSTPEELSRNLIKAAFGGANTDRLKNIDANGKRQVELLEVIANKKDDPLAGAKNLRNAAGQKPGFGDMAKRALQFGPNPQAVGL